jgi:hypothetical protein
MAGETEAIGGPSGEHNLGGGGGGTGTASAPRGGGLAGSVTGTNPCTPAVDVAPGSAGAAAVASAGAALRPPATSAAADAGGIGASADSDGSSTGCPSVTAVPGRPANPLTRGFHRVVFPGDGQCPEWMGWADTNSLISRAAASLNSQ